MMKRTGVFILICVMIISAYAQNRSVKTEFISVLEQNGEILVNIYMNGKSALFILDLAGQNTVVDEFADLVEAKYDIDRGEYTIENISIGNNVFSNSLRFSRADSESADYLCSIGASGTINGTIFKNITLTLDKKGNRIITSIPYKPSFIRTSERADCQLKADFTVEFEIIKDDKPKSVVFDTREEAILRINDDNSPSTADIAFVNVRIPGVRIESMNGEESKDKSASVGLGLLDYGLISIDYQRSKVYFQSYENTPKIEDSKVILKDIIPGTLNEITKDEFIEYIYDYRNDKEFIFKGDKPVVIDFWASWCAPCKRLMPIMEQFAAEYKNEVIFYKVNADEEKEVCSVLGVTVLPTLYFVPVDGKPIIDIGAQPEKYKEIIETKLLK